MPKRMHKWSVVGTLVGVLASSTAMAQEASNAELKKQIQALTDSVRAMQTDLQEIKALLQRGAPPPAGEAITLDIANRPLKGSPNAPVTLVEFTDYQCPFCGRYVRDTFPQIDRDYVATGKLKYVLLDLPLESIHKLAFKAAEAANCAGEQGKYWEMHDRLFANQQTLDAWTQHADAVGLDPAQFDGCLTGQRHSADIRREIAQAQSAGVSGTPGFFLALTEPGSTKVRPVRGLKGAQPYAAFKAAIDAVLAQQAPARVP